MLGKEFSEETIYKFWIEQTEYLWKQRAKNWEKGIKNKIEFSGLLETQFPYNFWLAKISSYRRKIK